MSREYKQADLPEGVQFTGRMQLMQEASGRTYWTSSGDTPRGLSGCNGALPVGEVSIIQYLDSNTDRDAWGTTWAGFSIHTGLSFSEATSAAIELIQEDPVGTR